MKTKTPQTIFLKDYKPPHFLIKEVDLEIELSEEFTKVKAQLNFYSNPRCTEKNKKLVLNGEKMELIHVSLDKVELSPELYEVNEHYLTIDNVPEEFILSTEVRIHPQNNTELEGLYKSNKIFCTQCESEGFRKITYFLDRPDVMSIYRTTIIGEKKLYPVMLSNGNLVDNGKLDDGRHWVKWEDPFPKPSYLFALVAGNLDNIEDSFVTISGREVKLKIYVESENIEFCDHAMRSLKESMRWDENRFGREYDLDLFMIVAVNDFNMGAMENKGLNIFNSKLILASQETATDADFYNIQGVVGHEYFHNWSGNRVTCRDWFQLSLKEGFTVFRDQEFSSDMNSRAVQRITDVNRLRVHQYPEDSGPMSHPIRPDSFMEINNFYTMTIYEKGAEVVRMLSIILGKENFRKGTDLYFERYDGQAVTCDNFIEAMEDANEVDLQQFRLWYSQSGTPEINIYGSYDEHLKTYTLTVRQSCPNTVGQIGFGEGKNIEPFNEKQFSSSNTSELKSKAQKFLQKKPFHIPIAMGFIDSDGKSVPLKLMGGIKKNNNETIILELRKKSEKFVFEDIPSEPIPSILRGFSAPVKLNFDYSNEDLAFLLTNDTDEFNRWEAGQKLMIRVAMEQIKRFQNNEHFFLAPEIEIAFHNLLKNTSDSDPALLALTLSFPNEVYLGEFLEIIDVEAIHFSRKFIRKELAKRLQNEFENVYQKFQYEGSYKIDEKSMGHRSLKNVCLSFLLELETLENRKIAQNQFRRHENMTDVVGALAVLTHLDCDERDVSFQEFEKRWMKNPVVMDKWFTLQAVSSLPNTLINLKKLTNHPAYEKNNPNKIRALITTFARVNQLRFHEKDGSGYEFLAEEVLRLDSLNPQTAARLVSVFNNWKNFARENKTKMNEQLQRIIKSPNLSGDVFEIVSKALD